VQPASGLVDGSVVQFGDPPPLATVGLFHGMLDRSNRFVLRQDAGDGEEAGLHDGVDAPPHAGFERDLIGVDDPEPDALGDHAAAAWPPAGWPTPDRAALAY
jgi:hypothetical protein